MKLILILLVLAWCLPSQQNPLHYPTPRYTANTVASFNSSVAFQSTFSDSFIYPFQPIFSPSTALPPGIRILRRTLTWTQAETRGASLVADLDKPRTETLYTTYHELQTTGGWVVDAPREYDQIGDYDDVYEALRIEKADGRHVTVRLVNRYGNCHHDDLKSNGGEFANIYNVPGRVIIGTGNYSPGSQLLMWYRKTNMKAVVNVRNQYTPANSADSDAGSSIGSNEATSEDDEPSDDADFRAPLDELLPNISRWSEVVAIIWSHQVAAQPPPAPPARRVTVHDIKYIIKHHIITSETLEIIDTVAERAGKQGGKRWSASWAHRITHYRGEGQFLALLATPHGKGIVFFLTGHPNEFGSKNIASISIWTTPPRFPVLYPVPAKHMLFTLTD